MITYSPAGSWIDTPSGDSLAAVSLLKGLQDTHLRLVAVVFWKILPFNVHKWRICVDSFHWCVLPFSVSDLSDLAVLVYKGTAFSIFGGRRSNYGAYTVTVDGRIITSGTSQSDNPSVRQLLGTASELPYGLHTVVLTNTGGRPIDIDSVEFIGQVGQAG